MLQSFLDKAEQDPRLSPVHISLFVTLWNLKRKRGSGFALSFFAKEVQFKSRIVSRGTYYRTLRELHNYGYLKYISCFNPGQGSQIIFDAKQKKGS